MGKKLLALLFAAFIIVSGIRIIQGQFRIGGSGPITVANIRPTIQSYIFQQLADGAKALKTATVELPKIPTQVGTMYDELAGKRSDLQRAIHDLQKTIDSLAGLKSDIQEQTPASSIRDPLINSINTLQTTLPILLNVFKQLDDAIAMTIAEKAAQVMNVSTKAEAAVTTIQNQDPIFHRDLPQRMDALGEFLKSFAV